MDDYITAWFFLQDRKIKRNLPQHRDLRFLSSQFKILGKHHRSQTQVGKRRN